MGEVEKHIENLEPRQTKRILKFGVEFQEEYIKFVQQRLLTEKDSLKYDLTEILLVSAKEDLKEAKKALDEFIISQNEL